MSLNDPNFLAILEDDPAAQAALRDLMESEGRSTLCFDTAEQFLASTTGPHAACLIADVGMPGISGLELQSRLRQARCDIPIIFITARSDVPSVVRAMKNGASDFFTKPFDVPELLAAVDRAVEASRRARRAALERADLEERFRGLTPREQEVLALLASGLLNKQIAAQLGIAEYTVQVHRGHIMRKMAARSFAALVKMADGVGLASEPSS